MIIKGTKQESQALRWLQKAVSKDSARPVLNGINVQNGVTVGCDGFRIHAIKTPDCLENGTFQGKIPSGDFITELEPVEGKYPDYTGILPEGIPDFTFTVNPKFLVEAAQGFYGDVRMSFYTLKSKHMTDNYQTVECKDRLPLVSHSPMTMTGKNKEDDDIYVVIMPMHDSGNEQWRPE